jgi:hypothetical protein
MAAKKVDGMDRETAGEIRKEVERALSKAFEDRGLAVKVPRSRYTESSVMLDVEVCVVDADGNPRDLEAEAFKANANRLGLDPDILNETFEDWSGLRYTVTGLRTRNRKYPVICEGSDGRRYKMSADQVRRLYPTKKEGDDDED